MRKRTRGRTWRRLEQSLSIRKDCQTLFPEMVDLQCNLIGNLPALRAIIWRELEKGIWNSAHHVANEKWANLGFRYRAQGFPGKIDYRLEIEYVEKAWLLVDFVICVSGFFRTISLFQVRTFTSVATVAKLKTSDSDKKPRTRKNLNMYEDTLLYPCILWINLL